MTLLAAVADSPGIHTPEVRPGRGGLEIRDLSFRHAQHRILHAVNLAVAPGSCVALVGPNGAGKSTLLRLIAGLLSPERGEISLDGRVVAGPGHHQPPHLRRVAMVFQGLALWPHMTAEEHCREVALCSGLCATDASTAARAALTAVGLEALPDARPARMSGGEQQRLAFARALVARPRLLLLDEPFASIDRPMRDLLLRLTDRFRAEGGAVVFVTHDLRDACEAADRIVVLRGGAVEQEATPAELHDRPRSRFTAAGLGYTTFIPASAPIDGCCQTPLGPLAAVGDPGSNTDSGWLAYRPAGIACDSAGAIDAAVVGIAHHDGAPVARLACGPVELRARVLRLPTVGSRVRVGVIDAGVFVSE